MPNTIDDTGFNKISYQDLRAEKAQEYKDGFANQNLKTDVESGVGQEVSISTFAENDLASRFETLLAAFDPTSAQGVWQSRLAIVMNKRRQDAVNSSVTLSITADGSGATVLAGFQVSNSAGDVTFQTTEDLVIAPSGTDTVEVVSIDAGPVEALAGTLVIIKTPVFGAASVTNTFDANIGRLRETDPALRIRMLASSSSSSATKIGLEAALGEIDGVISRRVEVNTTDIIDADGIPPKSVFPIVDGGADSEIAQALITAGTAAGIGYAEPTDIPAATIVSGGCTDPVTGQVQTAYWARPDDIQVYVDVNINKLVDYPADGDTRVANNIQAWVEANAEFGEDLYAAQLYTPVQDVPGAVVVSLTVGLTASPVDTVVPIALYQLAAVAAGNVVVS
jgi:uncharacterized phage protein gp47/JayE